jgi:succinoglycan biosynthesis protein ExoM
VVAGEHRPAAGPVAVGVCTYKRPSSLERALEHVVVAGREAAVPLLIIVVDNDGNDPAVRAVAERVASRSGLAVRYRIESRPGISAARNAVFAEAHSAGARFLAMVDDDEWPSPPWLRELLQTQATTRAVVVGGPVHAVFSDAAARMRKYAAFWSVQPQVLDGRPFVFAAGNFLIDLAAIADLPRPLFDDALGLAGGEDTFFFRGLFRRGLPMAWAAGADVFEEVPDARATLAWLRPRRFRVGNSAVRAESAGGAATRSFVKTLGLSLRLLFYPLLRREPDAALLGWLLEWDKVRGRYAAHFGRMTLEYARPR